MFHLVLTLTLLQTGDISPQEREFFESKIRPVLAENCYSCHSSDAKKLRGELLLDSRAGWQRGGESGAVILPGQPNESTLLSALRYEKFEMPPKAKLSAEVIADFEQWIAMGAPDPRDEKIGNDKGEPKFQLEERKKWWSLESIAATPTPKVQDESWARNDYDRFVLAQLEAKDWKPAEPASRNSWLRRVTYDLTGLPPTPSEVADFLADNSDKAFDRVVDRLLDSAHFGEQWARHWMDLVRYAETKAFEADYPMPNAYRYRDYLIRAFNNDVPYDQFVKEAIAGDLLPQRLDPETGNCESVIGPGYLYLTDGQHGPPDIHADEARIFDDMIDVIGKTFMSQTIACARCHDHKFDAITTRDYYSLYGVIASSRIDYADINSPKAQEKARAQLRSEKRKLRAALAKVLDRDLQTAREDLSAAKQGQAVTPQQKRWAEALKKKPNDVLRALDSLLDAKDSRAIEENWNRLGSHVAGKPLGKLDTESFGDWLVSGRGFGEAPTPPGDFVVTQSGDRAIASFVGGKASAGQLSSRLAGSIKSPTFTIEGGHVRVRVKGKNARVSLYVRHYELVGRGPTTGGTSKVINSDAWQTINFRTNLWIGEPAYIEVQHNGGEIQFKFSSGKHVDGAYVVLDSATNGGELPSMPGGTAWGVGGPAPSDPPALRRHLGERLENLAERWNDGTLTQSESDLLAGLQSAGVLDSNSGRSDELRQSVESYRKLTREIAPPTYVRSLSDGHGFDEPVYIRGSHKNLSTKSNPRHFMDALNPAAFAKRGSGRLAWAKALVSSDNPLTARVMVNRIWHHLFGRGIVASVDDFGHMGEKPSHPALLNRLAKDFVADAWSIKRMIRKLVLSSTYRMSSRASASAKREDPTNLYLQRMPIRRLQAESIRDTLLAVSGSLDKRLFGPSAGGDGGTRRSVYIQLRRRFMPDFLMTFDMPNATEPFGRRNVTSGPTQSLEFMNGPFVWRAAENWSKRVAAGNASFDERVHRMHREAFGRDATDREIAWVRELIHDLKTDETKMRPEHWKDICHTMLNRKELIFVY